jgi:uncharacterized protein (TIGR02996 family)
VPDSQGDELMREILAHPDDDAPRIVYADWLQSHTTDPEQHARAELIHAQCALEKAHASERPALQERVRAVLAQYRRIWTLPLARAGIRGSWRFRRGFLDGGTLPAVRFVEIAAKLFELAPMMRSLSFPEAANELYGLAASPYLARLDDVDLHQLCRCGRCKTELELPVLFASPHVVNLRTLSLADCRIESDNASRLFKARSLHGLRSLDLSDNRLDASSMHALAERGGTFTKLALANNPLGDEGARVLAAASELSFDVLDLGGCGITDVGAAALVQAPWIAGIGVLDLHGNSLGQGAAREQLRALGSRVKM